MRACEAHLCKATEVLETGHIDVRHMRGSCMCSCRAPGQRAPSQLRVGAIATVVVLHVMLQNPDEVEILRDIDLRGARAGAVSMRGRQTPAQGSPPSPILQQRAWAICRGSRGQDTVTLTYAQHGGLPCAPRLT